MRAIMLAFACKQQYHAMRAIAASGYKVHVLGRDCAEGLKYSRFCSSYHTFGFDPLSQSLDDALVEIARWAKQLSADIILPSDIVSTRLLAALAGRLPLPTCALPDPAIFDRWNDKWQFYQFCRDNDVNVPQTWLFADMAQLKTTILKGDVSYPFIIKPHDAMGGTGIRRIMNEDDLKCIDLLNYKPLLVQRLIIGGEVDISILANKGQIAVYAVQRNLPDKYKFIRHDQLLEQVSRLVAAGDFHGLAHFDAIEESSTGNVYLIECNPRTWLSIFASAIAGLNFVKLSINPPSRGPDGPLCLVTGEVGNSMTGLLKKLLKTLKISKADYALLKYNRVDLVGKKYCWQSRFDDSRLPPESPGSIAHQMDALAALRKL